MGVLYIASFSKSTFNHSVTSFVVYSFLCRCLELCAIVMFYAIIKSSTAIISYERANIADDPSIQSPNIVAHSNEDESESNSQLSTVRHPFYPRSPSPTTKSLLMMQAPVPQHRASDSPQRYYQKQQRSEQSTSSQLARSPTKRLQSYSPSRHQSYSPSRSQKLGTVAPSPTPYTYIRTHRNSFESRISGKGYAAGDEFSLREDSHSSTPLAKPTAR